MEIMIQNLVQKSKSVQILTLNKQNKCLSIITEKNKEMEQFLTNLFTKIQPHVCSQFRRVLSLFLLGGRGIS